MACGHRPLCRRHTPMSLSLVRGPCYHHFAVLGGGIFISRRQTQWHRNRTRKKGRLIDFSCTKCGPFKKSLKQIYELFLLQSVLASKRESESIKKTIFIRVHLSTNSIWNSSILHPGPIFSSNYIMAWSHGDKTSDGNHSPEKFQKWKTIYFDFGINCVEEFGNEAADDAWHTFSISKYNLFIFINIFSFRVYLQRNKRQTTDHLPMTLAVCGRDNFIARRTKHEPRAHTHHTSPQFEWTRKGKKRNNRGSRMYNTSIGCSW